MHPTVQLRHTPAFATSRAAASLHRLTWSARAALFLCITWIAIRSMFHMDMSSSSPLSSSRSSRSSSSSSRPRFSLSLLSLVLLVSLCLSLFHASSAQNIPELRSGVSQVFRSLSAGSWAYFSFTNRLAAADVVLGLTALTGNPDIYYELGSSGSCDNPTLTNYTAKNDQDGGGVLTVTNVAVNTKFCIGIYAAGGWEATGRLLVVASNEATATQNPIILNTGEPVNDVLRGGTYRYFQYTVLPPAPSSLSLSITQRSDSPGDPDLYVNAPGNNTYPRAGSSWLSVTESGNDIITINNPAPGTYWISVLAWGLQTAQYQMIVVSSDGIQELADGIAYPMTLSQGLYAYYQFTVPSDADVSTRTLMISATPLSPFNELSIYCSFTQSNPTRETGQYQWSSATSGADVVVISGSTGALRAGTYYCGVYADTYVRFHVTAQFRAKTALENGKSTREYIPAQTGAYFTFDMSAVSPANWTISTLPSFGQHWLFVSPANGGEPNPLNSSTWLYANTQSNSNRGQSLTIPASACPATAPDMRCRFTILVWALQDTSFDIVATTQGSPQELRSGQVVYGFSFPNSYQYFSFRVNDPRSNVTIILTSTDGDPNLYVSFTDSHPTTMVNDLRAESSESEVLYFDWTSAIIRTNRAGDMTGTYYMAVYGRTAAIWNIRVKVIDASNPAGGFQLQNGQPIQSSLFHTNYDYYWFTITAADWPNNVVITMQPYSGDPDLYVGTTTALIKSGDNTTWSRASENSEGNTDEITFLWNGTNTCNPTTQPSGVCTYYIAVYGWHESLINSYSLVAHTGNVNVLLANGNPFEHTLRINQSEYYSFANLHPGGTVVIMITPIQGDPSLYVSYRVNNTRPNATSADYRSNSAGGDMIVIRNATAWVYFIGVRSVDGQPARYTILATSYDPLSLNLNPVQLTNGRSVPGFADWNEYRHYYYTLRNANVRKLTFFVEKKLGDPDLYINHPANGTYPLADDATAYRFAHEWGSDVIVIRNSNVQQPIDPGTWRASIYSPNIIAGEPEASQYLLTVVEGGSTLQLTDGVPFQSILLTGEYDYFSYYVLPQTANNSLSIAATRFGGDIDLACDDVIQQPVWYSAKWTSSNTDNSDSILIRDPRPGTTYYCSAYGFTGGQYSIVASLASPVQLQAGVPFHMQQPVGGSQYYTFETSYAQRQSMTINVRPSQGRAFLYVSNTATMPVFSSASTYGWSSTIEYDSTQTVRLTSADCYVAPGTDMSLARCQYHILVWIPTNNFQWDAVYSITVETQNDPTTLEYGVNYDAYIAAGQTKYYKFYITEERSQWSLQMTTEFGDPDVYVSRIHQQPGPPPNQEWEAALDGSDVLTVDWNDYVYNGQSMIGTYYVAVNAYAPKGDVYYRMVLVVESESGRSTVITLEQGIPQTRALSADAMGYYRFTPSAEGWPYAVMITVIPLSGDPDLYVGRNFQPNITTVTYPPSTNPEGQADVVYIGSNSSQGVCNPTIFVIGGSSCYYGITVHSWSASHYQVLVTTMNANGSTTPIPIANGQTLRSVVVRDNYQYFYHFVSKLGNTVVLSVTPITGNPDMYASFNITQPTSSAYHYSSNTASGDMIVIRNATARAIWLGIHAAGFQSRSDFFVTASSYDPANTQLSVIPLQNGVQVVDFGARDDYKYFRYELTEPADRLTIGVIPRMGDSDLYINFGRDVNGVPRWPGVYDADWYSNEWNSMYDIKSIYNPQVGEYFIGVHAYSDTGFTIMAVRSGTILQMSNGVMYPGQLLSGEYQYYQFTVSQQDAPFTSKTLLFSLSTLSNTQDPDLYCSDRIMYPNHTNGANDSTSSPPYDMIRFTGESGQLHAGTYYCGVRAYPLGLETTYVFSAYMSDRQALMDGVPLYDSVMGGEIKYYTFTQQNGANASDVIVTTQVNEGQGVAWLYINQGFNGDPDIDNVNWPADWYSNIGNGWRHQQITLWGTYCANSATPCQYNIAVFSPLSSGPSSFTIVAASGSAHQVLQPGVIYIESISTQTQARYYQFEVTDPRTNITVVVDSFPNDVDLYISRRDYYPSTSSPEGWQYGNATGERAYITTRDSNFGIGWYWVTVYGYHPTPYTIRVTFDIPGEPSVLQLTDGQPVRDAAGGNQWRFYQYTPPVAGWPYAVNFALTPISGDADLFVRVTDGFYPTSIGTSTPQTSITWLRSSTSSLTDLDQINIAANVQGNCNPVLTTNATHAGCSYTIGVQAWFNAAEWYLVASTSKSLLEVRNGVTVGPTTLGAGQWNYYFFREVYTRGMTVSFSLVALRGNPDIYVSTLTAYPNATNSQWSSNTALHDMIFIPNANVTIYYVAVHAANQGGINEYTLTARVYNSSDPTASVFSILSEGIAYTDALPANTYRYWSFVLSSEQQSEYITFTVKSLVGDPDIYINYALNPVVYPTTTSSQWGKGDDGDDIVTIAGPQNGRYIIGIYVKVDTFYSITVTTAGSLQLVSAGEMYSGQLLAGQSNYYRYALLGVINQNNVLSFQVSLEYGNPDLYVSDVTPRPNATSAVWTSTTNGMDVITISNASQIHTGNWYATVYAVTDVSYFFSVSYGTTNTMEDCYPWNFNLNAGGQQRFTLRVPGSSIGDTTDTQVSLSLTSGYTAIYVGVNTTPQPNQPNSYVRSLTQQQAQESPNVLWTLQRQLCFNVVDCNINVLITNQNNQNNRAIGSITVASGRCAVTLQAGVSVAGSVDVAGENNGQFYRFRVPTNFANVTVQLTMTNNGNADLFCAVRFNRPGYSDTDWSSISEGTEDSRVLRLDRPHPQRHPYG